MGYCVGQGDRPSVLPPRLHQHLARSRSERIDARTIGRVAAARTAPPTPAVRHLREGGPLSRSAFAPSGSTAPPAATRGGPRARARLERIRLETRRSGHSGGGLHPPGHRRSGREGRCGPYIMRWTMGLSSRRPIKPPAPRLGYARYYRRICVEALRQRLGPAGVGAKARGCDLRESTSTPTWW